MIRQSKMRRMKKAIAPLGTNFSFVLDDCMDRVFRAYEFLLITN